MFEGLTTLLEIQTRDREALSLEEKKRDLIGELSEKENELGTLEGELRRQTKELTGMKVARKEREIELDSKLAVIQKMEVQLFQLKTNEEYQTLQKEIEALKRTCTSVEDEILDLMEGIERSRAEIAKGEGAILEVMEEIKRAREVLNREKDLIEAEIDRLGGEKKILLTSVPPLLAEKYERTMRHYANAAVVPVVDNICQGCYTNLPRHAVEDIRVSREPIFCQNCSRFLFLDE